MVENKSGYIEESRGWHTLSRLFRYPDAMLLASLESAGLGDLLIGLEELEVEYTRLFIMSYPGMLVPPFESWYYQDESPSALLVDIEGFYERSGLAIGRDEGGFSMRADHIAVELDFCGYLTSQGTIVERDTFIGRHPGRWSGAFAARLRQTTAVELYRFAADSLEMWISGEGKEFQA